jgi:uncharacterized protein (TIGR03435 family)
MRKSLVVALGAWLVFPMAMHAQIAPVGASVPAFDVVSIKPNKAGDNRTMIRMGQDTFAGTNISLKMMLRSAYGLTTEDQIIGLAGAPDSARFDVEAKIDADTVAALKKLPVEEFEATRGRMLQAMLADRFQLKVHRETKELSMYDLVIAKGGFKLKEADADAPSPDSNAPNAIATAQNGMKGPDGIARKGMMRMGRGELTAQGVPISNLANFLAQMLHKQVTDRTALTGKYDIHLKWQPDDMPAESHEATGSDPAPSIFTALQEQLGLRLESVKGPVDTIVIDHVEMPSEN